MHRPLILTTLLFLCFGLICQTTVNADDSAVVIEGRLDTTVYPSSGKAYTNLNFGYEVYLHDDCWLIKTIYDTNKYYLTGFDGTNVYSYFTDGSFTPPSTHPSLKNLDPGNICAGRIPLNSDLWTVCPWFAFCSGSLFAHRKPADLIPAPWGTPRRGAIESIFEPEIVLLDHTPYLPEECTFRVSDLLKSKILSTNWVNSTDIDAMRNEMKLYPSGFIGGNYQVISTTNFAGLEIPLGFECKHFMQSGDSRSWLVQDIRGTVTSISTQHLDSTQPPIPAGVRISVMDTRLRDLNSRINGFKYVITNGIWPVEVPVDVAQAFEIRKRNPPSQSIQLPNVTARRRAVWFVFLLLTLVPALLLFRFRKRL
jgi:hypothetical protein